MIILLLGNAWLEGLSAAMDPLFDMFAKTKMGQRCVTELTRIDPEAPLRDLERQRTKIERQLAKMMAV